jgi:hypothetical protein
VAFDFTRKMRQGKVVEEMAGYIVNDSAHMPRKRMEEIRGGFLNYVFQTYTTMVPHLIGFHMTIDSWRMHRDREGWRLSSSTIAKEEDGRWDMIDMSAQAPSTVGAVPRLADDIQALKYLMRAGDIPPLKCVRCGGHGKVYYGFGDASGPGFGASSNSARKCTTSTANGVLK